MQKIGEKCLRILRAVKKNNKSKTVPMLETYTNTSNVSSASAKAIYYISISMQKNKIIII